MKIKNFILIGNKDDNTQFLSISEDDGDEDVFFIAKVDWKERILKLIKMPLTIKGEDEDNATD
jgi:hypothetical protein